MVVILFCTAEEAKPLVPAIMSFEQAQDTWIFGFAESRDGLGADDGNFKNWIEDGATVETDFIGASEQECQSWALEQMNRLPNVNDGMIAIADERTAKDDTILLQLYNSSSGDLTPEGEGDYGLEFEGYGKLPAKENTWYSFRIRYQDSFNIYAALSYGAIDVVYPVYFGRTDELVDDNGVFNVERAEALCVE
ncbi:hypothetical protein PFICI_00730 [Pestalotiopsis fici W106-1]|uniref:Uncharacterized protein n=1 Tax=Pestalotiopsis fici (strain W106-1 / CGMCC3.15140) TaxID=1229662 RepID=W3XN14_PESFW|nr:uncharacterized protein PFICI_00730 [Pestalotiopsis fici W106-1]ETS86902.1 hypothetical protein PFICI_00730 [Pestalotiopsis fici W106-1]